MVNIDRLSGRHLESERLVVLWRILPYVLSGYFPDHRVPVVYVLIIHTHLSRDQISSAYIIARTAFIARVAKTKGYNGHQRAW